jgi:hypothetical protein
LVEERSAFGFAKYFLTSDLKAEIRFLLGCPFRSSPTKAQIHRSTGEAGPGPMFFCASANAITGGLAKMTGWLKRIRTPSFQQVE